MSIPVYIDTSPLESGHAHRGIGSYTRNLVTELEKNTTVKLVDSAQEAKLIHYPFFDFFQTSLPLLSPKPVVVTIHDVIPLQFPKQYPAGIRGSLSLFYQKIALRRVDAIITDSQASKTQIQKHLGVPSEKISVVPLAANKKISYSSKNEQEKVAKKYGLPSKFALYVGDINYNKNIPGLLKSFSQSKSDIKLVLVGKNFKQQPIPEWENIEQAIAKYHIKDRVMLLNNVDSSDDLAAIYSQAAVYIQPSFSEGFGLPILEAMQCNTPVICFKKSSMKEVGGEHAIYPEAVKSRTLAETIDEAVTMHSHDRQKWVMQAYSWSQTFNWKKTAQQTIDVYEKVIE